MQTLTIEASRLRAHCCAAGPAELSSKEDQAAVRLVVRVAARPPP
jgi:hypothetical protein